ncbi:MAG: hypothetical protein PHW69_02635 [Elusimicrobiaceae bacterium]|nr:hypothetical protein [Elusimicrobiaceae bacterium]
MGTSTNIVVGVQASSTLKIGDYGALETAARDAGFIKGGISIEHDLTSTEIKVDQALGPVDRVPTAESMKIKLSLAEATLENMAAAYGYPTDAVASGTFAFGDLAGQTHKTLFINVNGPAGSTRKYTFWKVLPTGKTTQSYKRDGETLVDVEFAVLCDTTKTAACRFGQVTDTAAA